VESPQNHLLVHHRKVLDIASLLRFHELKKVFRLKKNKSGKESPSNFLTVMAPNHFFEIIGQITKQPISVVC
jgi:hypothetical protein